MALPPKRQEFHYCVQVASHRQAELETIKQLLQELTVIVAMQRDGLQHATEQRDKLQGRLVRAR